jgi:hypothetical protein
LITTQPHGEGKLLEEAMLAGVPEAYGVVQKRPILGNTGERNTSTKAMEF